MVTIRLLVIPTISRTHSLFTLYTHETLIILRKHHTSNSSSFLLQLLFIVQLSQPFIRVEHTKHFSSLIRSDVQLPVCKDGCVLYAFLARMILLRIYISYLQSKDIRLPSNQLLFLAHCFLKNSSTHWPDCPVLKINLLKIRMPGQQNFS